MISDIWFTYTSSQFYKKIVSRLFDVLIHTDMLKINTLLCVFVSIICRWHLCLSNIYIYIYTYLLLLISMLWHRQAIFKSKGDKLCSSAECRIWTRGPRHQIASRLNARWQPDWAIEDQAKTWTRQPVPMISEHSAHLTPLSVDFRTWLWRYTYLLLLISMLWHRQAIFKSKGDKLCSSAECRIWTRGPRHQIASRLNARWQPDWAIEDQAKTRQRFSSRKETSCVPLLNAGFDSYIHTYMHTYMHACIHINIHTYIHTYIIYTYIYSYIKTITVV